MVTTPAQPTTPPLATIKPEVLHAAPTGMQQGGSSQAVTVADVGPAGVGPHTGLTFPADTDAGPAGIRQPVTPPPAHYDPSEVAEIIKDTTT